MMLPLSKKVPQHFARCSEHYEYEEKDIFLNFAAFIPVTCIDSCRIQNNLGCLSGPKSCSLTSLHKNVDVTFK